MSEKIWDKVKLPDEPKKSKCCDAELFKVESGHPQGRDIVFGQTYRIWIDYYYCSECGLMYKPTDKNNLKK